MKINDIKKFLKSINVKKYDIRESMIVDVNQDVFIENKIKELPIRFGIVKGNFDCSYNDLTTLKGCPNIVEGFFDCSNNALTSLKYGPQIVGDDYLCNDNLITDLRYSPNTIFNSLYCNDNKITTLLHSPVLIKNMLTCRNNLIKNTENNIEYLELLILDGNPIEKFNINTKINEMWFNDENFINYKNIKKDYLLLNEQNIIKVKKTNKL